MQIVQLRKDEECIDRNLIITEVTNTSEADMRNSFGTVFVIFSTSRWL